MRILPVMRSRSPEVRAEPEGRQSPVVKRRSDTPFRKAGQLLNTSCRCIGFISGLESMLSSASKRIIGDRNGVCAFVPQHPVEDVFDDPVDDGDSASKISILNLRRLCVFAVKILRGESSFRRS